MRRAPSYLAMQAGAIAALTGEAAAHGIEGANAAFVVDNIGTQIIAFAYLGAKHMVTGYDHLLFVLGVIFFLHRLSQVALYVSLFSLGHSITLLAGVLSGVSVDSYLVDAVIGLSVAYKAFGNLGGFTAFRGTPPNQAVATSVFGLIHGLGLATKVQLLAPSRDGLVANILAFNVGVEIGQLLALSAMLALIVPWRRRAGFAREGRVANVAILFAGFVLMQGQFVGFVTGGGAP
jgi:hypothetical protein